MQKYCFHVIVLWDVEINQSYSKRSFYWKWLLLCSVYQSVNYTVIVNWPIYKIFNAKVFLSHSYWFLLSHTQQLFSYPKRNALDLFFTCPYQLQTSLLPHYTFLITTYYPLPSPYLSHSKPATPTCRTLHNTPPSSFASCTLCHVSDSFSSLQLELAWHSSHVPCLHLINPKHVILMRITQLCLKNLFTISLTNDHI